MSSAKSFIVNAASVPWGFVRFSLFERAEIGTTQKKNGGKAEGTARSKSENAQKS